MAAPDRRRDLTAPGEVDEPRDLVAIYATEDQARRAGEALVAAGVPASSFRIGDPEDERAALLAEMRDEAQESVVIPNAAFIATPAMTLGMTVAVPVCTLVGALICFPFAFIGGYLSLLSRLLIFILVGAAGGLITGAIIGAGVGSRGPATPMDAERGVILRTHESRRGLVDILVHEDPLRVDEVRAADGSPTTMIYSKTEPRLGEVAQQLVEQPRDHPEGEWPRESD